VNRPSPRLLILCLVLISLVTSSFAADSAKKTVWLSTPAEAARISRIESSIPGIEIGGQSRKMDIKAWMDLYNVHGVSVAVFDNFHIVWAKTYGVKEFGKPDPVTLDTLFQAGSISKPVTAMATMHFVESGMFNLDADINTKLRSWHVPENEFTKTEKVTLRRLLSHSAGMTVHGFPGYAVTEPMPTLVQVLDGAKPANTAPVRVDLVPGAKFRYSGGGTSIVQLTLVDNLNKPFPQIMNQTVISKLGLKNSSYEQPLPPARAAQTATGYRGNGAPIEGRWHVYPEMAAAGLWTTPSDLAEIAIEMAKSKFGKSNRVISQKTAQLMLRPQAEEVGLGWFVDSTGKTDRFGHGGADEGFQANLVAFASIGRGVAIMANSDNGIQMMEPLIDAIAREYQWPGYTPWKPRVGSILAIAKKSGGTDAMISEYQRMRQSRPEKDFDPGQLNQLGYELLRGDKQAADAVKIFRLNVEMYPQNSNVYDSLGEAYIESGEKELAIANYKRSLELDPKNDNAVTMLKKLGGEWKPTSEAAK
jgi:CubicO group peptidase (beta-lactamase class C family)